MCREYPKDRSFSDILDLHILVPFRDRWDLTIQCLNSISQQNQAGLHVQLHLIDNGSQSSTVSSMQDWLKNSQLIAHYHRIDEPFNFSKLCNKALTLPQKNNQYFLFLNNDVVLEDPKTIQKASQFAFENRDCGAVGITLLFPNRKIQHLFAAPGVKIIAAHPFKGCSTLILQKWQTQARKVPALTGAFMLIPSSLFHKLGGFDERLPTTGQDIDFCLKLQASGYGCWVLPNLVAIHHESASRFGSRIDIQEVKYIYEKWQSLLTKNPEYPDQISRWSEQPVLRFIDGPYPYKLLLAR
jgi:GT2 family glycosyltransferase